MRLLKFYSALIMIMSCSQLFASDVPYPSAPAFTSGQNGEYLPAYCSSAMTGAPLSYHCPSDQTISPGSFVSVNISPQDFEHLKSGLDHLSKEVEALRVKAQELEELKSRMTDREDALKSTKQKRK